MAGPVEPWLLGLFSDKVARAGVDVTERQLHWTSLAGPKKHWFLTSTHLPLLRSFFSFSYPPKALTTNLSSSYGAHFFVLSIGYSITYQDYETLFTARPGRQYHSLGF